MVYYSCSKDENGYYQAPHIEIKDWDKGKQADLSNKDSSIIAYSLFKNLSFLDDYVLYSCIEVRNKRDTLFYIRKAQYEIDEVVSGDSLVVAHQDNHTIGGWWEITPGYQHRLDGDSLKWSQN